jgi:hypothetical protein
VKGFEGRGLKCGGKGWRKCERKCRRKGLKEGGWKCEGCGVKDAGRGGGLCRWERARALGRQHGATCPAPHGYPNQDCARGVPTPPLPPNCPFLPGCRPLPSLLGTPRNEGDHHAGRFIFCTSLHVRRGRALDLILRVVC